MKVETVQPIPSTNSQLPIGLEALYWINCVGTGQHCTHSIMQLFSLFSLTIITMFISCS